jgi:hypothetical protein
MSVRETLGECSFFDQAVVEHGFTVSNRDYRLVASICGQSAAGQPVQEICTYTYLFKLCVEAHYASNVLPSATLADDVFVEYDRWKAAGEPDGFVWGVNWANAYPGLTYIESSERAATWTERLGLPMHEVAVETNVYTLTLVFHDVSVGVAPAE